MIFVNSVKAMVPQKKKISSVPWVKHINSIGTIGSEDIMKIRDKNSILKTKPSAPPAPPVLTEETSSAVVAAADEDELAGMPVLFPCIDISSSSSQVSNLVISILCTRPQFKVFTLISLYYGFTLNTHWHASSGSQVDVVS
jgi:hypothetical protein